VSDLLRDHIEKLLRRDYERLDEDIAEAMWLQGDGYLDRLVVVVATDKRGMETGSSWGVWEDREAASAFAVELYRRSLEANYVDIDGPLRREWYVGELRGHDLACWCPLDQPCHGDVLLELANAAPTTKENP